MPKLIIPDYALFGNPVNHSKSPQIHKLFSKQIDILYNYESINIPMNNFSDIIFSFFKSNGKGANITAPFKEKAYLLADRLTNSAKISKSVNTFKKINNKYILGDNTDGIGLLSDLLRLHFIEKHFSILILGAGGAVRGILFSLLSFGCSVSILNRTLLHAEKLVFEFNQFGKIDILTKNSTTNKKFDLIINATSRNINYETDFFCVSLVSSKTFFYDMNYQIGYTPFINWCIKIGAKYFSDGIGMLVFQAAHSCFLWHNILPSVNPVIKTLKKKDNF
ncbi:shikimate dehydrogenase [Buchnera aphidicola]|uniref:shikimate dehydrogenase n=1 Tax=Buchnera aphidicola TaxID=9 RepID=UPI003BEECE5A